MGLLVIGAGLVFGGAIVLLATFFRTKDERYDRIAEWGFVLFAVLGIPAMVVTAGRLADGGTVVGWATVLGGAGVLGLGMGELGSSLGRVDFRKIAPLMTAGFLLFLVWIGVMSWVILAVGALPAGLGWLGLGSITLGIVIVMWIMRDPAVRRAERGPGANGLMLFFVPLVGLVAWMIWLGLVL